MTTRGRFGLPPEPEGRTGLVSAGRAFGALASAALIIWLLAWVAVELREPQAPLASLDDDRARLGETRPPTREHAVTIFQSLYRGLRSGSAGQLLARGVSEETLRRDVPLDGRTLMLELLWLDESAFRVRQSLESRDWDVDISGRAVVVGRGRRHLTIEWTVALASSDWLITEWAVVEDRVVVGQD